MEAFSKGFLSEPARTLVANQVVTPAAIKEAKGGFEWGTLFMFELADSARTGEGGVVAQPLLLADVSACWAPSAEAVHEITARMATFDDTVPGAVPLAPAPELFRQATGESAEEPAELTLFGGSAVAGGSMHAGAARGVAHDPIMLEKLAGAISMLRTWAGSSGLPVASVADLVSVPAGQVMLMPGGALEAFALHVYDLLAKPHEDGEDRRIFTLAAAELGRIGPGDGIDPESFVGRVASMLDAVGDPEGAMEAFAATLAKILGNRIELAPSKLDDAGKVGQRALLAFCLAPTVEQLERLLVAKRAGPTVSALAAVLSGSYCGLGGIPAKAKAPTRDAFLSTVVAASAISTNQAIAFDVASEWDDSATRHDRVAVRDLEFFHRTAAPNPMLMDAVRVLREADAFVGVRREDGAVRVRLEGSNIEATASVGVAKFRLPASQATRFSVVAVGGRRGQLSRDLLADMCAPGLLPVIATIGLAPRGVVLEIEVDASTEIRAAVSQLANAVVRLRLAPVSAGPRRGRSKGAGPRAGRGGKQATGKG